MKDKYKIIKNPKSGWDLFLNDAFVSNYRTREDARAGKKAWKDLFDFSNIPPIETEVRIYRPDGVYP